MSRFFGSRYLPIAMVSAPASLETSRAESGPTDAVLVAAARAGDGWAKEALFLRHAPRINGLVFRLLGRDTYVDDLVQDVFVAAFTGLGRLDDPQSFGKWTMAIATRLVCKRVRKNQLLRRLGLHGKDEPVDVDSILGRTAPPDVVLELRMIFAVIEELPAEDRAALVLRRVEGFALDEIAAALGISLATTKRRLARAEHALERRLEGAAG